MRFVVILGSWVFEVIDRARAVALTEADPYLVACPRAYRLLARGKAVPHLQALMYTKSPAWCGALSALEDCVPWSGVTPEPGEG